MVSSRIFSLEARETVRGASDADESDICGTGALYAPLATIWFGLLTGLIHCPSGSDRPSGSGVDTG
jgi:hypothetical protein